MLSGASIEFSVCIFKENKATQGGVFFINSESTDNTILIDDLTFFKINIKYIKR